MWPPLSSVLGSKHITGKILCQDRPWGPQAPWASFTPRNAQLLLSLARTSPHCISSAVPHWSAATHAAMPLIHPEAPRVDNTFVFRTHSEDDFFSTCMGRTNMASTLHPARCMAAVGVTHVITTFPTRGTDTAILYTVGDRNFIQRRHIRLESPEGASGVVALGA